MPIQQFRQTVYQAMLKRDDAFFDILPALYEHQPPNSEQIAGYELYALDTTPNERPEIETLEDRGSLKAQKDEDVSLEVCDLHFFRFCK